MANCLASKRKTKDNCVVIEDGSTKTSGALELLCLFFIIKIDYVPMANRY